MKKRKWISVILLFIFMFCLTGCYGNHKKATDQELYYVGLDLIQTIEEMIKSEEYTSLLISGHNFSSLLEKARTNDYDSPVAVYSVTPPDIEELLAFLCEDMKLWYRLSDNLQQQIKSRISFDMIIDIINADQGAEPIVFSSTYSASKIVEELSIDENKAFIYVFEESIPIAVSFSKYGGVVGRFVFLENVDSLSAIREVFEEYNYSVEKMEIK